MFFAQAASKAIQFKVASLPSCTLCIDNFYCFSLNHSSKKQKSLPLVSVKWLKHLKTSFRKWSGARSGLKMSETGANVQRNPFKDLQKAWRTVIRLN